MFRYAYGPLRLRPEDLWTVTLGELSDMAEGLRYREYLETRKAAMHASWIINGSGMVRHPVRPDDLAGVWMDGRIVSKREAYDIVKARVKKRRGVS